MKGAERDNSEDLTCTRREREVWRELRVGELVRCQRGFGQYQSNLVFGRAVYDYVVRSVGEFRF